MEWHANKRQPGTARGNSGLLKLCLLPEQPRFPSMATSLQTAVGSLTLQEQQPSSSPSDREQEPSTSEPRVQEHLVLRLVPKRRKPKKGVQWADDVVDNEFLNKRSSKKCCIFHRQRAFGEWSDEEDSDGECEQCVAPS